MFRRMLKFLISEPKSMLDYAITDINKSSKVVSLSGDINNAKIYIIGSRKMNDRYSGSVRFDCFNVMFNKNDKEVMIKKNNEVLYFFTESEHIKKIRDTIIAKSQSL